MNTGKVLERTASLSANFKSSRGINLHQNPKSAIIKSDIVRDLELSYIRRKYDNKNSRANI